MGEFQCNDNYSTIIEAYSNHAKINTTKIAYTYQNEGTGSEEQITFGELDRKARSIATYLVERGAVGERVILLFKFGLKYIEAYLGCLYAGAVPVPAYPPSASRFFVQRLRTMIPDSQAKYALTTSDVKDKICKKFNEFITDYNLMWIELDKIEEDYSSVWKMPDINEQSIAFLQYTSGSTSTPKGVIVSHGNLVHNIKLIVNCFKPLLLEDNKNLNGVIWLPPYHDMGLIGGMLALPYFGRTVHLMSPFDFIQQPYKWLESISRLGSAISAAPNFAFDNCVKYINEEQKSTLDLSKWKIVFNGGEPINPATLERFSKVFESCGFRKETFYPCFGMAESSLIVSGGKMEDLPVIKSFDKNALEENTVIECVENSKNGRTIVGCGRKLSDGEIRIVDIDTQIECKNNQIGEIWLASPSVAKGYWNKKELTESTFQAHFGGSGQGPFLRTGDIGFIYDCELFITGRLKDLIIINGRNINPNDIEHYVETLNPMFRMSGTATFSVEVDGDEAVVIIQEVQRGFKLDTIKEAEREIKRTVKNIYDLDIYDVVFVKQGYLKRTSSGKIKRRGCKEDYLKNEIQGALK